MGQRSASPGVAVLVVSLLLGGCSPDVTGKSTDASSAFVSETTQSLDRCIGNHYCLSLSQGPPGTVVMATGPAVGETKGGRSVHDTMVQTWWELDPDRRLDWTRLGNPSSKEFARADLVGQQFVAGLRRFHFQFRVPDVQPGIYRVIEVLYGGGYTGLSFNFHVSE